MVEELGQQASPRQVSVKELESVQEQVSVKELESAQELGLESAQESACS